MPQRELIASDIRRKLSALRTALRGRLLGEGFGWLIMALVALVFVTLALDYTLRLDLPLRIAVMVTALTGVALVAWTRMIDPLRVSMDTESLALLVERRYGDLDDRLISALQLAGTDPRRGGMSPEMVQRVVEQANRQAGPLNFRAVIDSRGLLRSLGGAGGAMLLLGVFAVFQLPTLQRWFQRNVLLAEVDWPQKTYLRVTAADPNQVDDEGNFTVLRGEDLKIVVIADGQVEPASITLHADYPSVGRTEEQLDLQGPGSRRYVKTFQTVAEPLSFYVTGGDDRLDRRNPHQVRVIEPPTLEDLVFMVEYPDYQQREADRFDGTAGIVPVTAGCWVTVSAVASKDLSAGRMVVETDAGEEVTELILRDVELPDGTSARRGVIGRFPITGSSQADQRALRFVLRDAEGYVSRRGQQFVLQVQPDVPPSVDGRKEVVSGKVTAVAMVPFALHIRDDFAVRRSGTPEDLTVGWFVRARGEGRETTIQRVAPAKASEGVGRRNVQTRVTMDLAGLELEEGDTLRLGIEAEDTLPVDLGGPNIGRSALTSLQIVSPAELMEDLVKRQKEIRVEFVNAILQQATARAKTVAAREAVVDAGIDTDVRRKLDEATGIEAVVASEVVKASDRLMAVLLEMRHNQLSTPSGRKELLDVVINPIRNLHEPITEVQLGLDATGEQTDPAVLAERLQTLIEAQGRIQQRMEQIAEAMEKHVSRQELANRVDVLQKRMAEWIKAVDRLKEEQAGDIFDELPGSGPDEPNSPLLP